MKVIDKLIEQWYRDTECRTPVHEYVGLTLSEYDDFMNHGMIPPHRPELAMEFQKQDTDPTVSNGSFVLDVTPAKREV